MTVDIKAFSLVGSTADLMEVNKLVFPAPSSSYTPQLLLGELVWIPQSKYPGREAIPCLWLQHPRGSNKLLVYFHGNAEDIGYSYELMDLLRCTLNLHVMCVEYPGYGLYKGKSSASRVTDDALNVFNYLTKSMGLDPRDIIVFGRSIGTGPATWLATHFNPCALLLMSPYTSLKSVIRCVAGRLASFFVRDRFRNIDLIPHVKCPVFILHGQQDALIPFANAQNLKRACIAPCWLFMPEKMDHNVYDFFDDLAIPLLSFFAESGIEISTTHNLTIPFPVELFQPERDAALPR
jgi:pimeloyl-ACP methyl ester carboxylesterase